jgi:NADH-quinone oxidoreductase subunit J
MINPRWIFLAATVAAALGLWLLLPRGTLRGRAAGAVFVLAGLGGWASQLPGLGDWLATSLFAILALVTVLAAVATVTLASPLYAAIWFGMTLVGTAGLFLLTGAQFLAVATLVVYAGAILVTLLFVLMLAHPEGQTSYDRRSHEALLSAVAGAVAIGILGTTLAGVLTSDVMVEQMGTGFQRSAVPVPIYPTPAVGCTDSQNVARLGTELFTRHLVAVEVAGTLLFAALVGAAVIVAQGQPRR